MWLSGSVCPACTNPWGFNTQYCAVEVNACHGHTEQVKGGEGELRLTPRHLVSSGPARATVSLYWRKFLVFCKGGNSL